MIRSRTSFVANSQARRRKPSNSPAELLFVNLLISRQVRGDTKRAHIAEVLSWAETNASVPPELSVSVALDNGLINPGTAYAVQKPFGLVFLIRFLVRWKSLREEERATALADPWAFKALMLSVPAPSARAQQAALLHLVFPDTFEAIVSEKHKELIAQTFAQGAELQESDLDQRLLLIRNRLTAQFGERYSYYRSPSSPGGRRRRQVRRTWRRCSRT
jgi:5-methylcytosine-specific restriction enzyme B